METSNSNSQAVSENAVAGSPATSSGRITVTLDLVRPEGYFASDENALRWIASCLNCNVNHVQASVSLVEPQAPLRQDAKTTAEGALDVAVNALALAAQDGGELNLPFYRQGFEALVGLRGKIAAYDAGLAAKEASPDGSDYEALLAIMRGGLGGPDRHLQAVDAASEALLEHLDHSGVLDSVKAQEKAYALRAAVVRVLGDPQRIAAADQSVAELVEADIQAVADDVMERGEKYGFRQDEDSVREAVDESASLLSITLTDAQAALTGERVMAAQRMMASRERG